MAEIHLAVGPQPSSTSPLPGAGGKDSQHMQTCVANPTYNSVMALPGLEAISTFEDMAYDSEAQWATEVCTDQDMFIDDLHGDVPETVRVHRGSIEHTGDLDLEADEYGYYVIDGDLRVDGILNLKVWDAYNPLAITGTLSAKAIVLHAEAHLYVLGQTNVTGPLVSALGDGGYCALLGDARTSGLLDLGRVPPELGDSSIVSRDIPERYSIDNVDEPIEAILKDLRAGKSLD